MSTCRHCGAGMGRAPCYCDASSIFREKNIRLAKEQASRKALDKCMLCGQICEGPCGCGFLKEKNK